jgi:hypothetical protein
MRIAPVLLGLLMSQALPARTSLIVVFVVDGLRPDVISQTATPNLYRLKTEGTWCANSHSVFPTVTRVNSSSISTGTVPAVHGIVSNTMYVEGVDTKPFDTANYTNLVKLAGISAGGNDAGGDSGGRGAAFRGREFGVYGQRVFAESDGAVRHGRAHQRRIGGRQARGVAGQGGWRNPAAIRHADVGCGSAVAALDGACGAGVCAERAASAGTD